MEFTTTDGKKIVYADMCDCHKDSAVHHGYVIYPDGRILTIEDGERWIYVPPTGKKG